MDPRAAGPRVRRVPAGDDRERLVCPDCGFVAYENPKIVVGSVATWGDRILLCRRSIEPRRGFWTLPAGFLELGESPEEGARREAWEEARARLELEGLLAVYTIRRISQVQMFFRASLSNPEVAAGPESEEVALFDWGEVPWDDLAFPTVHWALDAHARWSGRALEQPETNPKKAPGLPSEDMKRSR